MKCEEILALVKTSYHTEPKYLWKKHPNYAVLRHQTNRKWYGLLMEVERRKLGLADSGMEEIMNLKCPPELISELSHFPEFLPAYHMNKTHWISVRLEKITLKQAEKLIDKSFQLTK